jgi:hypothetical protein
MIKELTMTTNNNIKQLADSMGVRESDTAFLANLIANTMKKDGLKAEDLTDELLEAYLINSEKQMMQLTVTAHNTRNNDFKRVMLQMCQ